MGPDLSLWEGVVRMLVVVVLAGAVGLERELRDQEAGLGTHMLVGLGATLFVIVGNFSWSEMESATAPASCSTRRGWSRT